MDKQEIVVIEFYGFFCVFSNQLFYIVMIFVVMISNKCFLQNLYIVIKKIIGSFCIL